MKFYGNFLIWCHHFSFKNVIALGNFFHLHLNFRLLHAEVHDNPTKEYSGDLKKIIDRNKLLFVFGYLLQSLPSIRFLIFFSKSFVHFRHFLAANTAFIWYSSYKQYIRSPSISNNFLKYSNGLVTSCWRDTILLHPPMWLFTKREHPPYLSQ